MDGYHVYLRGVGKRIAYCRKCEGLTQQQLADRTGLTQSTIARIEKGHKLLRIDTLLLLVEALQARPDYLLGYVDVIEDPVWMLDAQRKSA